MKAGIYWAQYKNFAPHKVRVEWVYYYGCYCFKNQSGLYTKLGKRYGLSKHWKLWEVGMTPLDLGGDPGYEVAGKNARELGARLATLDELLAKLIAQRQQIADALKSMSIDE